MVHFSILISKEKGKFPLNNIYEFAVDICTGKLYFIIYSLTVILYQRTNNNILGI